MKNAKFPNADVNQYDDWSYSCNSNVRALLDHIAKILAEEYVERMKKVSYEPAKTVKKKLTKKEEI